MIKKIKNTIYKKLDRKFFRITREKIAFNFLFGEGIEIGAMDIPLMVKKEVKVKYLDRISKEEQVKIFKDLDPKKLVEINYLENGETLTSIENESQDFIIANHMLEHCQNPVETISNFLRVLKPNGIIFLAIPDKRYTFDNPRMITSWEHILLDYQRGPAISEFDHYYDFVKNTHHGMGKNDEEISKVIQSLRDRNFSIHFHVWDHSALTEFFVKLNQELLFPIEIEFSMSARPNSNESIFVLRKRPPFLTGIIND